VPIGTTLSGANRHDMKKAADTIDAIVTGRPDPEEQEQHLCTTRVMTILRPVRRWLSVGTLSTG